MLKISSAWTPARRIRSGPRFHTDATSASHPGGESLEASGVHRSLGVHISFVRSVTMDSWKPIQLRLMELGGNASLKAFFREQEVPENMPIAEKYNTKAADWYRKNLRAQADGRTSSSTAPWHWKVADE
ncbi:unnamed protein product [Polarella glacialis]|uniref:Arf-GAP domain-containing protein n=1 Tax=Polarella glacialis TaxID=89957 RepID=A0A813J4P4_POLGL|nr:unnamed protein product [Polarella glacialis]